MIGSRVRVLFVLRLVSERDTAFTEFQYVRKTIRNVPLNVQVKLDETRKLSVRSCSGCASGNGSRRFCLPALYFHVVQTIV